MPPEISEEKARLERVYIADGLCDGGDSGGIKGMEVVVQERDKLRRL